MCCTHRVVHDFLEETFGHIDVLINNAGIIAKGEAPALKVGLPVIRATLETNALGAASGAIARAVAQTRQIRPHGQHVERHGRAR